MGLKEGNESIRWSEFPFFTEATLLSRHQKKLLFSLLSAGALILLPPSVHTHKDFSGLHQPHQTCASSSGADVEEVCCVGMSQAS